MNTGVVQSRIQAERERELDTKNAHVATTTVAAIHAHAPGAW